MLWPLAWPPQSHWSWDLVQGSHTAYNLHTFPTEIASTEAFLFFLQYCTSVLMTTWQKTSMKNILLVFICSSICNFSIRYYKAKICAFAIVWGCFVLWLCVTFWLFAVCFFVFFLTCLSIYSNKFPVNESLKDVLIFLSVKRKWERKFLKIKKSLLWAKHPKESWYLIEQQNFLSGSSAAFDLGFISVAWEGGLPKTASHKKKYQ